MKLMKWLKRDRSNRRCSDSQIAMVTSPFDEKSLNGADPIRTKEYLQALSEFRARRSLGLNFEENFDGTPERNKKSKLSNTTEERKIKSDQKPKRKSLSDSCDNSRILSQTLPQIQFLFSNQIFMPGNRQSNKKRNRRQKTTNSSNKSGKHQSNSTTNTPDFEELSKNPIDIEADDSESPPSPPPEFFRNNSLPYVDKEATMPLDTSNNSSEKTSSRFSKQKDGSIGESQKPLLNSSRSDIYETIRRLSGSSSFRGDKAKMIKTVMEELVNSCGKEQKMNTSDLSKTSIDSIARKLEEKCHIRSKILSKGHFRGVPLVRRSTLSISSAVGLRHREPAYTGEGLTRAHWDAVPVTLRGILDAEYTTRDIDILSSVHHPNILLLMGITYDADHRIECVFEECTATLFELLYEQKIHLSLNACVDYLSDIANAASHLFNSGYVHTAISSHTIMITSKGVAKLFGFELCSRLLGKKANKSPKKKCEPYKLMYSSPEPEYENLKGRLRRSDASELNCDSTEVLHNAQCTPQDMEERELLTNFRWQAPELFDDVDKKVTPTKSTDVYSICLVLWECFNGIVPWKSLSYKNLSDLYLLWQTGIRLKKGRYPVLIHDILTEGLSLDPEERMCIKDLCRRLTHIKNYVHFGSDSYIGDINNYAVNKTDLDKSDNHSEPDTKIEHSVTSKAKVGESNLTETTEHPSVLGEQVDGVGNSEKCELHGDTNGKHPICINLSSILCGSDSNLDDTDTSDEPASEQLEMSPDQNMTMHNTNSTEYCSLLTPDVKKFASRLHDASAALQPSKLTFDESLRDIPESSLQEKIMRLNSNFTPKSYTPLEIKAPSLENNQQLSKMTKQVKSAECERKGKYRFDVQSTSLPNTPIARNTKIRKYAWLTGKDKNDNLSNDSVAASTKSEPNKSNSKSVEKHDSENDKDQCDSKMSVDDQKLDDVKLNVNCNDTEEALQNSLRDEFYNHTLCEGLSVSALCTDRNPFRSVKHLADNPKFRSRSQSWSSRSRATMRNSDHNITGVDIRPLVAIHEKWIEEAKQKHNRSLSLPDNYRGPLNAVKPASHRVDPVPPHGPNNNKSHSFITAKKAFKKRSPIKGPYHNIPNPVRPAIAKSKTLYPKPDDFFENSLWKKEKEKCKITDDSKDNPQSSSTPYKNKSMTDSSTQSDQATNTETFEELCEMIIRHLKLQGFFNSLDQAESRLSSMSPTFDIQNENIIKNRAKENKDSSHETYGKFDIVDKPTVIDDGQSVVDNPVNLFKMESNQNTPLTVCKNMQSNHINGNQDDDCQSLPEMRGEAINKTLKRCQAFSALQTARSTEDMYIDDELSANNDIHALSDNMLLIPMHSSIHEALCDKASNCCLVKIKEESSNETILIVCDNSQRNLLRPRSSCSTTSDSEFEPNDADFAKFQNLQIETLPPMNLVNSSLAPQALSVIEEIPGEEETPDVENNNSKNIQELINLYETSNKSLCKNAISVYKHSKDSRADEISFLILDNMEECDGDLSDNCDNVKNNRDLTGDSVIQDYIMI